MANKRSTRKETPQNALRKTGGYMEQSSEAGSRIENSETNAKDQWGIGTGNANMFREEMRDYSRRQRFRTNDSGVTTRRIRDF